MVPAKSFQLDLPDNSRTALNREQLDRIFQLAYEELRQLAFTVKNGDPSATLSPTALVHEAWVKLSASPSLAAASQLHFKRIAARAMRQLLVEAARRRNAEKRGGVDAVFVTFDEGRSVQSVRENEVIALHHALEELAEVDQRQAEMVELRFFGGFDVAATANLLGVSEETIHRDWRAAKAWLARQIRGANRQP